jgi:hypothetical protein
MATTNEDKRQYCLSQEIDPSQHCCLQMAYYVAHPLEIPHQGPNRVVDWIKSWNEYRIPASYDGYSSTRIDYCPWCGKKLPDSKREHWYQALYKLGYDDPGSQDIPEPFQSDQWWRKSYRE